MNYSDFCSFVTQHISTLTTLVTVESKHYQWLYCYIIQTYYASDTQQDNTRYFPRRINDNSIAVKGRKKALTRIPDILAAMYVCKSTVFLLVYMHCLVSVGCFSDFVVPIKHFYYIITSKTLLYKVMSNSHVFYNTFT